MNRLGLVLFALDNLSAMAIDRAGADWVGGPHRRVRAEARARLYDAAMDTLLCGAPQSHTTARD
jgi:hypothetical protein